MVRIRLKTKLLLAINGMVFLLVALFCYVYISHRLHQSTQEAHDMAAFVASEIEESAHEATQADLRPLDIDIGDPQLVQAAIESRLRHDKGLSTLLQTIVAYAFAVYDAGIVDVDGRAIVHTTPASVSKVLITAMTTTRFFPPTSFFS